jgi:hypothetical protein
MRSVNEMSGSRAEIKGLSGFVPTDYRYRGGRRTIKDCSIEGTDTNQPRVDSGLFDRNHGREKEAILAVAREGFKNGKLGRGGSFPQPKKPFL